MKKFIKCICYRIVNSIKVSGAVLYPEIAIPFVEVIQEIETHWSKDRVSCWIAFS